LRLPVKRPAVSEEDLRRIDRELRALHFNPERFIGSHQVPGRERSTVSDLLVAKQDWIERDPSGPNARERYLALRRLSEALRPWVANGVQRAVERRQEVEHQLRAARLLGSREYPFCFYPWDKMQTLLLEFPPPAA
jgi:hypothetical protein